MSRNVPFVVTTFTSRDLLRDRLLKWKELQTNNGKTTQLVKVSAMENLAVGITSALIAGVVTQPIDVIKTRMMTQAASAATPYTSAVDCALTVVRTEGWRKLYSGFGQRSVYMCGLWGITFAMEPIMFKYLNERNTHQ